MRRLVLGKVGYVGDPSNRFNIGGHGDRYWTHRAGWLRATSGRAAVLSPGSEHPTPSRDAEHAHARAGGRTTDGAEASRYE